MPEGRIPLARTIALIKKELADAVRVGADEDIQFPVSEVTLEFQVGVTKESGGNAGVNVWVLELGASGSYARETVQTLTVTLGAPADRQGRPIKVTEGSLEMPR